ncbi:MAG: hypothetical protein ABSA12_12420 [Verrucomicrobiia bacterium]|jgi:hypothetical protein
MALCDWFAEARDDYVSNWALLDKTLYDLCDAHPRHDTILAINAKIQIIGLSYQTGIQRHVDLGQFEGLQGGAIRRVTNHLFDKREDVDAVFVRLRELREPLSTEQCNEALCLHNQLLEILTPITRGLRLVSFPAKYMHFHCRAMPIFDRMAYDFIRYVCDVPRELNINPDNDLVNPDYLEYVQRFYSLYKKLRENCGNTSVKLVDHFINFANESDHRAQMIHSINGAFAGQ